MRTTRPTRRLSRSWRSSRRRPAATASSTPIRTLTPATTALTKLKGSWRSPRRPTRRATSRSSAATCSRPRSSRSSSRRRSGAGGEIQLTDAIKALMAEQDVYAYAFEGKRYDAGTTMGWLKASVELALERPDIGAEFRRYLAGLDLQLTSLDHGANPAWLAHGAHFVGRGRTGPRRPLPAGRAARPGRHGDDLPRPRRPARPRRRGQGAARRVRPRSRPSWRASARRRRPPPRCTTRTWSQVFDYGMEVGRPFIVMELIDGGDLAASLTASAARCQPLPRRASRSRSPRRSTRRTRAASSIATSSRPTCC